MGRVLAALFALALGVFSVVLAACGCTAPPPDTFDSGTGRIPADPPERAGVPGYDPTTTTVTCTS